MILFARILIIVYGILTLLFTYLLSLQLSMTGFPEGYRTAYDKATEIPYTIVIIINLACSVYFFYSGFSSTHGRLNLGLIVCVHFLFCALALFGIDFFFKEVLNLDHGQGG